MTMPPQRVAPLEISPGLNPENLITSPAPRSVNSRFAVGDRRRSAAYNIVHGFKKKQLPRLLYVSDIPFLQNPS